MALLRTIAFFAYTGLSMVFFLPIALVLFVFRLLGLAKPVSFIIYKIAQAWAISVVFMTGCRPAVRGRENIPPGSLFGTKGVCFVSNHVGIFDIVLCLAYAGRPFGFIAKKELAFVPGVNIWVLLLNGLFIDRKNPRKALATINKGVARIKAGGGMLIFPEGTRSRGRGIAPFHPGALKLATRSEADIVPVAITGSYEVFEKTYRVTPSPVFLSFLPPVRTTDLPPEDRKQILAAGLHDAIAQELTAHASK